MDFDAWIRQPTTLHGLAVAAAGVGVALTQLATGNPTYDAIIGVIAYVAMHLGVNDNSVTEQAVTAIATDVIRGAPATKIANDAAPLLAAVIQPQPVQGPGAPSIAAGVALLLAASLGLSACAVTTTPGQAPQVTPVQVTPAQIVSDLRLTVNGLDAALTTVMAADPSALGATGTQIQGYFADAQAAAAKLLPGMDAASGADQAQQVIAAINAGVGLLAGPPINGLIPAPFGTAVAAFNVLLPGIEAFVTPYLTAAAVSPAASQVGMKARLAAPQINSTDAARAYLLSLTVAH